MTEIDLNKDYHVKGKLVSLQEFMIAAPNLMNNPKKTNNVKALELMSIIKEMINNDAEKTDIKTCLKEIVPSIKSSHNRKMINQIIDLITSPDWERLTKNV